MTKMFIAIVLSFLTIFIPTNSYASEKSELVFSGILSGSILPLLAMEKGWFKEEGINLKFQQVLAGKIVMDHIISGDADIGTIVDTNVALAGFQKNTYFKIIASHQQSYSTSVFGRKDRGISKPQDLIGKKIGVQPSIGSHFNLHRFLKKHGIGLDQIEEVYLMSPVAVRAAIISGDVDAVCLWEPHKNFAIKNLKNGAVDFYDREIYQEVYRVDIVLAVSDRALKEKPEVFKKFLHVLVKAEKYAKENKEEVIKLMSKKLMLEEDFLHSIWQDWVLTVSLTDDHYSLVKEGGKWIIESQKGFANKALPDYRRLFEPDLLKEVAPEKATLH